MTPDHVARVRIGTTADSLRHITKGSSTKRSRSLPTREEAPR